jgi:hypothetical protein
MAVPAGSNPLAVVEVIFPGAVRGVHRLQMHIYKDDFSGFDLRQSTPCHQTGALLYGHPWC